MSIFGNQYPYSEIDSKLTKNIFRFLDNRTLSKIVPRVSKDWYQFSFEENYIRYLINAKSQQSYEKLTLILLLLGDYCAAGNRFGDATKLYYAALAAYKKLKRLIMIITYLQHYQSLGT